MSETTNHSIVMLRRLQASKTFVCVYKILHFCANLQKFQTLVPAKNSHLNQGGELENEVCNCVDTHGDGCAGCGASSVGCISGGSREEMYIHSQCWQCVGLLCACTHILISVTY